MSDKTIPKVAILLSMISILAVLLGVRIVTRKMDNIAAMQFGGADNYKIAQQLFSSEKFQAQQKAQLQGAVDQINKAGNDQQPAKTPDTTNAPAQNNDETAQFPTGKLNPDQLVAIKKNAVVQGDKNAKITIVEYSDPECPFCIRHFNDKTIENAVSAFAGKVNHIFKPVQGVNHPGTEYKSLAILCAAKLQGDDAFVGMYSSIFAASTTSAAVPTAKIAEFAQILKINTSDLEACITKGDTKAQYAANWAEFQTFTSKPGTPGNIVINNETGEWKLIAGAYPTDTFKQIIGTWVK